ncbi:phosphoenolpyruvate hydrolase family protein [Shimia sp. R11_0]|uniref:phosphoenolpyruvate hydrolase family protein n=1 Tax=Shimia sp. R11_0 TaxID=2821096 RepID=UPI001ADD4A93|nr:phosphoenolpyruvate hydrolase family protein [Shimia sp. R11_0]MBO9479361.1 phosphoenolpyruvate hydrolase family protein [Shimia sp. R11_0]
MKSLTLSGRAPLDTPNNNRIFCPTLAGLSASQADLGFLMPRLDHNRAVRETARQGAWAAVLASDPFGSEIALFSRLQELGYSGIINWPSSILLEGNLRQSMSTIPASPAFEYDFLARAKAAGLETMAFFLSLEQARLALQAGLDHLILHPGLLSVEDSESGALVLRSLQTLLDTLKIEDERTTIYAYTSSWHERLIPLSTLSVDGVIWYEDHG